jgi:hypothetical protein
MVARKKARPSRFASTDGERTRPVLATTVSVETDERLRAYAKETGIPLGRVLDRAVALYLDEVT